MGFLLIACATASAAVLGVAPGAGRLTFQLPASLHTVDGEAEGFVGTLDTDTLRGSLTVDAASLTTGLGPRDSRMTWYCLEAPRFAAIQLDVTAIDGAVAELRSGAFPSTA